MNTSMALVRSLRSLAVAINAEHEAVERASLSALEHARSAGILLVDAKDQLKHGEFLPWLATHCPDISVRTAQGYMQVARHWPAIEAAKAQRVAHLSLREALRFLAADDLMPIPWAPAWDTDGRNEDEYPTQRKNPETEFRCPACAYEWRGQPKPWVAGGRAMADARDRAKGVRRIVLICPAEQRLEFWRHVRQLEAAFGTPDHDATVVEAVRRMATEMAAP